MTLHEPGRDDALATPRLAVAKVALAVRDLAAMTAFYRRAIGLQVVDQGPGRVGLGTGGRVLLDMTEHPGACPDDPAEAGLFHTAFLLPSRADLGRWLSHGVRHGRQLDGAADHLVSEAAYLTDPEGNGIEVYADRPPTQWRWGVVDGVRQVAMANRPLDFDGLQAAGGAAAWGGVPEGTRIGHVHLRVGDIAEAGRFYAGVLGLDVTTAWPAAMFLSTGGYHHHLAVNTWHSAGAGRRDPHRAGLAAVTFATDDLPGLARRTGVGDIARDGLRDPWGTLLRFQPVS